MALDLIYVVISTESTEHLSEGRRHDLPVIFSTNLLAAYHNESDAHEDANVRTRGTQADTTYQVVALILR